MGDPHAAFGGWERCDPVAVLFRGTLLLPVEQPFVVHTYVSHILSKATHKRGGSLKGTQALSLQKTHPY